jgi:hypothetical protein
MIRIEPFHSHDLRHIVVQSAQQSDWPDTATRAARGQIFEAQEHGRTFFDADLNVIACFGMVKSHAEHYTVWSVLSALTLSQLLFATRWGRAYLNGIPARRIDTCVRASFDNGHQWVRLLGFEPEGVQRAFYENGDDMHVYVRRLGMAL